MLQKQEKSLHLSLKQTEQWEVNSVSNMKAKIDIDALKISTKSRTNETEYRQNIKNSQSQLKIYRFKNEECTSTSSLLKNFET